MTVLTFTCSSSSPIKSVWLLILFLHVNQSSLFHFHFSHSAVWAEDIVITIILYRITLEVFIPTHNICSVVEFASVFAQMFVCSSTGQVLSKLYHHTYKGLETPQSCHYGLSSPGLCCLGFTALLNDTFNCHVAVISLILLGYSSLERAGRLVPVCPSICFLVVNHQSHMCSAQPKPFWGKAAIQTNQSWDTGIVRKINTFACFYIKQITINICDTYIIFNVMMNHDLSCHI